MPSNAKRPAPLSVRLTAQERLVLEQKAQGVGLSTYLKACALDPANAPKRLRGAKPIKDHGALAAAMARLGRSGVAETLETLATAARSGGLVVAEDTQSQLEQACRDLHEMRLLLLKAMGGSKP